MSSSLPPEELASTKFGFLSVIELPQLGFCGGLLVVSAIGRPVEFHCTAPVKPNRTQQIMYGTTYRGFLFTDQIAAALIQKVQQRPSLFLTDNVDLIPLGDFIDESVLFVEPLESTHFDSSEHRSFATEDHRCWFANPNQEPASWIRPVVQSFASKLPLDEPIERIAQAVEEAHSVLRAG